MWVSSSRPPPPPLLLATELLLLLLLLGPARAEQASASTPAVGRAPSANALPLDQRFFLKQIFDKYGHDGIMTFEGFEHLLESLGLARVAFDKHHGVGLHRSANGTFREVHDALRLHLHDHAPSVPAPVPAPVPATGHAPAPALPAGGDQGAESGRARRALPKQGGAGGEADGAAAGGGGGGGGGAPPPRCLSPREMLVTFGLEANHGVAIDAARFLNLCPIIVYELDQRSCFLAEAPAPRRAGPHPSAWAYASLSVLAASAVGLLAAAAAGRLLGRWRHVQPALAFLMALGAGTLCGDALLHLLPHALSADHEAASAAPGPGPGPGSEERAHPQEGLLRAAAAFGTMAALFALETLLHRLDAPSAGDGEKCKNKEDEEMWKGGMIVNAEESCVVSGGGGGDGEGCPEARKMLAVAAGGAPSPTSDAGHGHSHGGGGAGAGGGGAGAIVWMVLLGDGVHNLTDGLAIGAAFCDDLVAGFATALAVFCHELPHEFGDFAVLLKSGMSLKHALFYNVVSSVLSFIGMAIGVWVGNFDSASQWIYAVTAGSFLYIALADLIPELSRNNHHSQTAFLHLFGLLAGGGIMLVIALYEDALRTLFE